ncbi:hypothetical protein HMPREF0078_1120 [Anaerococcus vaginalis ATCC 51170]|uniref:Uncharacterized protein n=1 Tax=Anaerococcus vaginalis ATCC 51170 TaxID=655811 RepID=C7HUV7_9FIRM|nr:hypothetical protein HMPREF0078_1120 [Anaerococcus vaginalis ATCC 51170]
MKFENIFNSKNFQNILKLKIKNFLFNFTNFICTIIFYYYFQ